MADNAGALLVRAGLIGEDQLLVARRHAAAHGGTVGEHLVLNGFIDDEELTRFFHTRLMVPRVDPNQLARIPSRMIRKVPADMALEFRIVPVSIDREQNLTVAMSDPSNTHAVDEVGFFTGCYVMRAVATQRQLAWCLAHYYGHVTPLGETLLQPSATAEEPAPARAPERKQPSAAPKPAPVAAVEASPADGVPQPVEEDAPVSITGKVQAARRPVRPPLRAEPEVDGDEVVTIEAEEPREEASAPTEAEVERGGPRAPSPLGTLQRDDARAPCVSFVEETTSPTGPMKVLDKLPAEFRGKGELSPRVGEVRVRTESDATPLWEDSDLPAVVVGAQEGVKSEPILLARQSRSSSQPPLDTDEPETEPEEPPPDAEVDEAEGEDVLVLDRPKRARARRNTNVGLGRLSSSPAIVRPPTEDEETPAAAPAAKSREAEVTPPITPRARSVRAERRASPTPSQGRVPRPIGDEETERNPTGRFQRIEYTDPEDDGFGPPGSTIPPQFLGAMPDAEDSAESDAIPLLIDSSGITGRVATPPPTQEKVKDVTDLAATLEAAAEAQRALEASSQKLIETLRRLDQARTRDHVIDSLLDHLVETFACVSFFVVKGGRLCSFRTKGIGSQEINQRSAELALDSASTFQDIVSTRLPFHGPLPDRASRVFAAAVLGEEPEEILAMPCAVRDRVVGILFGSHRRNKRIIQEHVAVVLRAAGQALERIVRARKGSVPGIDAGI